MRFSGNCLYFFFSEAACMKCFFVCFRYSAVMYDAVLLKLRKQPACGMEGFVKSLIRFPVIVSWERTEGKANWRKTKY